MKRRSKDETRARIIDAAYGPFWRQGFLRVSADEIAARAGITKRTLYQHFPSKDDIITAALAHSSELALARFQSFPRGARAEDLVTSFFAQLGEWAGPRAGPAVASHGGRRAG
jgi:AcrR family transcriptional regulator